MALLLVSLRSEPQFHPHLLVPKHNPWAPHLYTGLPPARASPSFSYPLFPLLPLSGFPAAEVFTLKPLEFGKPNTLVCFVSNLFPPMLTVSWEHNSKPVQGVGPTTVSAISGLSFQAFSYLNFTPQPSDLFSCIVTHEIDRYTAIAYWGEAFPTPACCFRVWARGRGHCQKGAWTLCRLSTLSARLVSLASL